MPMDDAGQLVHGAQLALLSPSGRQSRRREHQETWAPHDAGSTRTGRAGATVRARRSRAANANCPQAVDGQDGLSGF